MRVAAIVLGLALAACGKDGGAESAGGAAENPLRVGVEAVYEPFEFTNAKGEIIGFDVDLARGLSAELGRTAEFRNMAFDALLPELESGRIDVICSALSFTEERARIVAFTRPYVRTSMGVLVHKQRAPGAAKFANLDAPEVSIAVQRGTSGETKAREVFPKARIVPYETEVDAAAEVGAGRMHAYVYDMVSVRRFAEKYGDAVRVLPGNLGSEDYCIAFPKGSPLVAPANAFLDRASAPGGLLHQLAERWKPAAEVVPPGAK